MLQCLDAWLTPPQLWLPNMANPSVSVKERGVSPDMQKVSSTQQWPNSQWCQKVAYYQLGPYLSLLILWIAWWWQHYRRKERKVGDLHAGHALLGKFACQKADCSMGTQKKDFSSYLCRHRTWKEENNEDENVVLQIIRRRVDMEEGVGQPS